jgi:hypothetical protein
VKIGRSGRNKRQTNRRSRRSKPGWRGSTLPSAGGSSTSSPVDLLDSEPELVDDAALALALALDPADLWSVIESGTSSEALEHVPDDERLLEAATEVHAELIAAASRGCSCCTRSTLCTPQQRPSPGRVSCAARRR